MARHRLAPADPRHHAVVPAVAEVGEQADPQPHEQPQPVLRGQGEHQEQAGQDPGDGHERAQGRAKRPLRVGVHAPHDEHRGAHDHEREQGADVGEVGQDAQGQEGGPQGHEHSGEDGGFPGRAEAGVDRPEDRRRQQAVAGDGQEDARLAEEGNQDHAGDAREGTG